MECSERLIARLQRMMLLTRPVWHHSDFWLVQIWGTVAESAGCSVEMEQCEIMTCGQWNGVDFGPAWCGLVQIFTGDLCALSDLVPPRHLAVGMG